MADLTGSNNMKGRSVIPFTNPDATQTFNSMEKMMNTGKEQFERMKSEATATSRQGMEAMVRSSTLLAQGMEQYFKTIVGIAQSSAERQGAAFKQLMTCKTMNEVSETQNKIAQDNFEELMQTATKLSEISIKIATEVFEPINEEITKNVGKATEAAAA